MLKGVSKILAAAVAVLAIPVASQAAVVTLSYQNVQVSTSPTFSTGITTITVPVGASNVAVPIAAGSYLRFNVTGTVVGDAGPTGGYLIDSDGDGVGDTAEPTNLGIASFRANVTNTNAAVRPQPGTSVAITNPSTAVVNSLFAAVNSPGVVNTATGSVGLGTDNALANGISGGNVINTISAADPGNLARFQIGTSTVAGGFTATQAAANNRMFSQLVYQVSASAATGSAVLTALFPTSSMTLVTTVNQGTATSPPAFDLRNFGANPTDTVVQPGTLTLAITGTTNVPEPTSLAVLGLSGVGLLARRRKA